MLKDRDNMAAAYSYQFKIPTDKTTGLVEAKDLKCSTLILEMSYFKNKLTTSTVCFLRFEEKAALWQ